MKKKGGLLARPFAFVEQLPRSAAEVDNRATVLRLADARTRRNQRIVEALAFDGDAIGVKTFADHLVLDRLGTTDRQRLVVAVGADGVGVAGDEHLDEAVRLRGPDGFRNHFLRLVRQVRLIEVEEDNERLHGRRRRRWRRWCRRRWRRRWRRFLTQSDLDAAHDRLRYAVGVEVAFVI